MSAYPPDEIESTSHLRRVDVEEETVLFAPVLAEEELRASVAGGAGVVGARPRLGRLRALKHDIRHRQTAQATVRPLKHDTRHRQTAETRHMAPSDR